MSEEWFWNTEPRVVVNMINEKQRIDKEKAKMQAYYIACFAIGENPDEDVVEQKQIPGIDKPVSESALKSFNL